MTIVLGVIAIAGLILWRTGWRAILFLSPGSIRIEPEDHGRIDPPPLLEKTIAELEKLGFTPLGTHWERPWLGPPRFCFDLANAEDCTYVTVSESSDGRARVSFLSELPGGGYAITSNYRRPAREEPGRYVSGWLEDIPPERVYKAHVRRLDGVERVGDLTLEQRVLLEQRWYAGPGRSEVRQQHLQGLLWSLGSLGMVAAAIFGRR